MITIKRSLDNFIYPEGKKYNKPVSLGIPQINANIFCPTCIQKTKTGEVIKATVKENASAMMCKVCWEKEKASK